MRRLLLPVSILTVAIVATILAVRADDTADKTGSVDGPTTTPRVATPVLSATRIPDWLRQPETDQALAAAVTGVLDAVPDTPPQRSCLTVHRDTTEVASINGGTTVQPGSLQRLVTAAAALEIIPADSTFTTDAALVSGAVPVDGVLLSNLWLIGKGDPTLSTPGYIGRFSDARASTDLDELADDVVEALAARGVTTIGGAVLGDESRYLVERAYPEVWDGDDNSGNTVGPLSALLVDDGFESWPDAVDQAANTRASNPAATAATRFVDLLVARGVTVANGSGSGDAPDGREVIATVESERLDAIIPRALVDGTTAEMLLKEIGVRSGGPGDRGSALFGGVLSSLQRLGIPLDYEAGDLSNLFADGSGISDVNRVTCTLLAAILDNPDVGPTIAAAMPLLGDSSLSSCAPPGAEGLRVMSSAEEDHTTVAGVFEAANGDDITFVMMASGPNLGATLGPCNALQAQLLDTVAGHPYGPGLDPFLPRPPITE